jgi:uncharacterized membrane protein YcfT
MKDLFSTRFVLQRNRFAWIDYARGACIILVVFRHCFEGLTSANLDTEKYTLLKLMNISLFSFRMPLFFLLSGIFVAQTLIKKSYKKYVVDRFKVILYPLLIWGVIQITLQLIFLDYVNADRKPIDYLNLIIRPRKIEQFWYLNTLFMVGIIYAFFKAVLHFKIWHLMITGIVFYSAGAIFYVIHSQHSNNIYIENIAYSFLPDFLHFYIYFFIGDLVSSFVLRKENQSYFASVKMLMPILVVFLISHYYFTKENLAHEEQYRLGTFVEHFQPLQFLVISLSGCALMIQLSFILQRFAIMKFLRVIGYHSLYIYVSHLIVVSGMRTLMVRIFGVDHVPTLILINVSVGIVIPIIVYNILVRLGCWWLYSLKKPEDEITYHHSKLAVTTLRS